VSKALGGIFFAFQCQLEKHKMQANSTMSTEKASSEVRADGKSSTHTPVYALQVLTRRIVSPRPLCKGFPTIGGKKRCLSNASYSESK
jgi:hypothetical protein